MSSSRSGNVSNNSQVDQSSKTKLHELNTLERDGLLGSEEADAIQCKTKLPIVKDLMVQCLRCEKWRLIPSMKKYEIIREKQLETPFCCDAASEWRPNMSCDVPEDGTTCAIWAMDVPSIPCPPTRWEREVHVRREGSTNLADVKEEDKTSINRRCRKVLDHPENIREGVNLSQFSFEMPKPRDKNYVKKRTLPTKPTVAIEGYHRALQRGQSFKKTRR